MSLIRKHVAVLQAWACLALVFPGRLSTNRHENLARSSTFSFK